MIPFALAAAALLQWTGPHTIQYTGPGFYCGGGYRVALGIGERALILPQSETGGVQSTRLVLSHGEVNVWSGARAEPGRVVSHYGDFAVTEQDDGQSVAYLITNQTPYGLRLTSNAFRGFKQDRWFFSKADFAEDVDHRVVCLAALSY